MEYTIGSNLGGFLALFEDDLMKDGCANETLAKIHQISEIYRNFSENEFGSFNQDFAASYASAKKQISHDYAPSQEGLVQEFPDREPD